MGWKDWSIFKVAQMQQKIMYSCTCITGWIRYFRDNISISSPQQYQTNPYLDCDFNMVWELIILH